MKLSSPPALLFKILSFLMILSLLAACGNQAGDSSSLSENGDIRKGELILGEYPKYLGFVSDHEGQPIPYAMVGGTEIATEEGVASGDFVEYEGQWIPVTAPGYASSYAKTLTPINGHHFFDSTLTPYLSMSEVFEGEESILSAGLEGEVSITIQFSSEHFDQAGLSLGLTPIHRMDITPNRVAYRSGDGLRLRVAFAVQAFTGLWDPVQLVSGRSLPLTIKLESPLSDEAVFTTFDPVEGVWVERALGCTSADGLVLSCQLPELNPLWAIFDNKENFMKEGNASRVHSPGLFSPLYQEEGNPQEDFNLAYFAWNQYMIDNLDNENFSFSDPALLTLLSNLEKAAKKFTERNRNESGKKVLVKAGEAAIWSGAEAMNESLDQEAAEVSEDIAKRVLGEVDCGEYDKLIKVDQQLDRFAPDSQYRDQITEKLKEITGECDIWTGWITVTMYTVGEHPAGLPMSSESSGGAWREIHSIKLWTNVKTMEMHGKSVVQHSFPTVTYLEKDPCVSTISMSAMPGRVDILYLGKYNGVVFDIFSERPEGEAVFVTQAWNFNSLDDDACKQDYYDEFAWKYYSLTTHGIGDPAPIISLQQMLDEGNKSIAGGKEAISGNRPFTNPDPELAYLPFHQGIVNWKLIHDTKGLPKPE